MSRFKITIYTILLCIIGLVQTSCKDDFGFSDAGLTDGMTIVSLEASFSPFAEGNLTRSLDPVAGDVMKDVKDLAILVYDANSDADGNHVLLENLSNLNVTGYSLGSVNRGDGDASSGTTAEAETKQLSNITLTLPFGRYYIIGVANLKGGTENYLKSHPSDYLTLDGLLRMRMAWDETNIANNGEMLGYFNVEEDKVVPSSQTSFTPITVNNNNIRLHSWLRRCASKITIDFDGSELRDNVYIYIKEARIYDLAKDCTLGSGQPINFNSAEGDLDYNNRVTDATNGFVSPFTTENATLASGNYQVISYGSGSAEQWPLITKGTPKITQVSSTNGSFSKDKDGNVDFHSETSPALYFYENMQGESENPGKLPVANTQPSDDTPSGGLKYSPKDNVPCGTFIEVIAYYHSDASGNAATGVAKYRFMLGKDAKSDYNAERNYHYKLTLKFHGNANDYDWHIDYKDRPGFNVPNPWYVSYLYNHDATLPFKFTPDDNWVLQDLDAEIDTNPWYPTGLSEDDLTNEVVELISATPPGDERSPYNNSVNKLNCNGFLSLRASTETVVTDKMAGTTWTSYENAEACKINESYYLGRTASNPLDMSKRVIMKGGKVIEQPDDYPDSFLQKDKDRETITYQQKGDTYSFNIPLFTRSKVMVKQTGYSGNNYFVGYERVARVKLTAIQKNKTTGLTKVEVGYVNVVQVRRIVNPKGVYRRAGNNEPFEVKMMWLDGDNTADFTTLISRGPWKADIIGDANFITLDGKQTVSGSTNTPVKFTIMFNRTNTDNTVRNACVRVRYHNLTCTHLIFVRQGYDPIVLSTADESNSSNPAAWSTFNMIGKDWMASDPRDEGSLFKYGNPDEPIDAVNNIYQDATGSPIYGNLTYEQFEAYKENVKSPFEGGLLLAPAVEPAKSEETQTPTYKTWGKIGSSSTGFSNSGNVKISKAARMSDFEDLYLSKNIEFGYGVLYADGATTTATSVADAYGYWREDEIVKTTGGSPKGMRGLFAYHSDGIVTGGSSYNARSVFFPIGRAGYGHRKDKREGDGTEDGGGILRYACTRGVPYSLFSDAAPVFVSIYRREGAIYWSRDITSDYKEWNGEAGISPGYGLDINYFSYDVNAITEVNISEGADACFVRCVEE